MSIMITIKLVGMWITAIMIFYGLTLNSQSIVGDLSLNMIILGVMDALSNIFMVFISPRIGRRFGFFKIFAEL